MSADDCSRSDSSIESEEVVPIKSVEQCNQLHKDLFDCSSDSEEFIIVPSRKNTTQVTTTTTTTTTTVPRTQATTQSVPELNFNSQLVHDPNFPTSEDFGFWCPPSPIPDDWEATRSRNDKLININKWKFIAPANGQEPVKPIPFYQKLRLKHKRICDTCHDYRMTGHTCKREPCVNWRTCPSGQLQLHPDLKARVGAEVQLYEVCHSLYQQAEKKKRETKRKDDSMARAETLKSVKKASYNQAITQARSIPVSVDLSSPPETTSSGGADALTQRLLTFKKGGSPLPPLTADQRRSLSKVVLGKRTQEDQSRDSSNQEVQQPQSIEEIDFTISELQQHRERKIKALNMVQNLTENFTVEELKSLQEELTTFLKGK
jgi:hypothetical protein